MYRKHADDTVHFFPELTTVYFADIDNFISTKISVLCSYDTQEIDRLLTYIFRTQNKLAVLIWEPSMFNVSLMT